MTQKPNDIHISMFAMNMADAEEDRTSWTQETLANLERCYERRPFRLTIIDNGSTCERWRDYLNRYDPPMLHAIIRYRENQGLCWPENLVWQNALQQGAKFVGRIDNDTFVEDDYMARLEDALTKLAQSNVAALALYPYEDDGWCDFPLDSPGDTGVKVRRNPQVNVCGNAWLLHTGVIKGFGLQHRIYQRQEPDGELIDLPMHDVMRSGWTNYQMRLARQEKMVCAYLCGDDGKPLRSHVFDDRCSPHCKLALVNSRRSELEEVEK